MTAPNIAEPIKNKKRPQPIQRQIYCILTAILAGIMLISVLNAYLFYWPALIQQDKDQAMTNSLRVYKLFKDESNDLKRVVSDWAVWDDSYNFMDDGNKEYVQSNLAANTYINLDINDIMYVHNDGRVIWAKSLTPDQSAIEPTNKDMLLAAHRMYVAGLHGESGIMAFGNELFFIEISEVVDSAEEQPPIGIIAMTRRIDQSFLDKKRDQLKIDFKLSNLVFSGAPGTWTEDDTALTDSFSVDKQKTAFLVTFAIPLLEQGNVPIIVRTPRHVTLEAKKLLIWNSFTVLLSSLLLLWSINLLLKKRVISPLHDISSKVNLYQAQPQGALNLDHAGSMELEQITDAIESMHTRIMEIATHDPLTGLPNRRLLDERMKQAEERSRRQGNNFIVLCIDLDGFKQVNDTYGHGIGDLLLQNIAGRLLPATRVTDTVSRVGGDEFIVLLDPGSKEHSDIEGICKRLIQEIETPLQLKGKSCAVSASIGVAIYPDCTQDISTLLKMADKALYEAKSAGKATYRFASAQKA